MNMIDVFDDSSVETGYGNQSGAEKIFFQSKKTKSEIETCHCCLANKIIIYFDRTL